MGARSAMPSVPQAVAEERGPRSRPTGRGSGAALAGLMLLALVGVAACGGTGLADGGPQRPSTRPGSTTAAPGAPAAEACVADAFDALTPAQRVGQLFMVDAQGPAPTPAETQALTRYHAGSVILRPGRTQGAARIAALVRSLQSLARQGGAPALLVAADQEGGAVQVLRGAGFSAVPAALQQGRWPETTLQQQAAQWGRELRSTGVTVDLAPVADVVPPGTAGLNPPIGRYQREFGSDPAAVGRAATAFARGLAQSGVLATLKHFPGLGRVRANTDFTASVTDDTTLPTELDSFRAGIQAGVPFVMISLATYKKIDPAHQAVYSPVVIQQLLRGSLGFGGVVISDDLGRAASAQSLPPGLRATTFIAAGGDMVLTTEAADVGPMTSAVLTRMRQDAGFRGRVDESVRRVLTAKAAAGLLPHCSPWRPPLPPDAHAAPGAAQLRGAAARRPR